MLCCCWSDLFKSFHDMLSEIGLPILRHILFDSSCLFANSFYQHFSRWFCRTNHLVRQVTAVYPEAPGSASRCLRTVTCSQCLTVSWSSMIISCSASGLLEGRRFHRRPHFTSHQHKSNPAASHFFIAKPIISLRVPGLLCVCKYVTNCLPAGPSSSY